jgi:hypothetical protein
MSEPNGRYGSADILGAQIDRCVDRRPARAVAGRPDLALETLDMTHEHHDTVVVEDERGGTGMGAILGIIAIIVLLVAVWWVALGPGAGSGGTTNNNTINNGGNAPAATERAPASS